MEKVSIVILGAHRLQPYGCHPQGWTPLGWEGAASARASSLQTDPSQDCAPLGRAGPRVGFPQGVWFPKCSMAASALYQEMEKGSSSSTPCLCPCPCCRAGHGHSHSTHRCKGWEHS